MKTIMIGISKLMENLPNLTQVTTSSQFSQKLRGKIHEIDNRVPSIWQRLLEVKPFGFDPVPAVGFTLAIVMIIGTSFLLLNQEE